MGIHIAHANILEWAASYDGPLFHALLCDPPYHLVEITKRFGKEGSAPAQYGKDGAFQRASKGFMGRDWDGGDIAYRPATWAALGKLLHPGAFLMAFAGSRGYHRMACAIEDAGFIIHPAIGWAFGSGFPKATRIDTQIDATNAMDWRSFADRLQSARKARGLTPKDVAQLLGWPSAASVNDYENGGHVPPKKRQHQLIDLLQEWEGGAEREIVGQRTTGIGTGNGSVPIMGDGSRDITAPATDLAQAWQGHRYGGQALKPAFEFICVAQKPYAGRPVDSITRTGAGALNIDGARISGDDRSSGGLARIPSTFQAGGRQEQRPDGGRWPSNLVLAHDPRCEPRGVRRVKGTKGEANYAPGAPASIPAGCAGGTIKTGRHYADADGCETVADWQCHPDCAVAAMGRQSGERPTPAPYERRTDAKSQIYNEGMGVRDAGDTMQGFGDTGTAARFFFNADYLLERLEDADAVLYEAKSSRSEREAGLDPRQVRLLKQMEERETWASQDHDQNTQAETDIQPSGDIIESSITADSSLPMLCDGCKNMGQSPKATRSTTKTTTSKTTESTTSSLSTRSPISDSTADASSETASGGNLAVCAMCSSPLPPSTGIYHERDGRSTENAERVTSQPSSETSNGVDFPVATINDGRQKPIDNAYQRGKTERRNIHPCLKPLSLARHLATLLLPPAEYAPRRLLIPFSGAGSEMIGALLAGWEDITGVELEADHVRIAEARIAYWQQRRHEFLDPSKPITATLSDAPDGQLDLFEDL